MGAHRTVVFVCLHGAAKSVIAAEHFARLARERGLAVTATSAGTEPDPKVPAAVVAGLLDHIHAYLDGRLFLDHRDARYAAGRVGLWTKADSVTAFDDL